MERPAVEGGLPDSITRPLDRDYTTRVLALEHERLKTLGEAAEVVSFFFEQEIDYDLSILIQKKMDAASTKTALEATRDLLNTLPNWEHETMEAQLRDLVAQLGLKAGQLFGAIRTAVSGRTATPPLFQMMEVLGREVTMKRIDQAIAKLS
jgi:glutamyl-tRNA synthetase